MQQAYIGGSVQAPRSRLRKVVVIGVLILVLMIVGLIANRILNPSPQKKAENLTLKFFNELIFDGAATKAYALTDDPFKKVTNLEKFTSDSTRLHKFYTSKFKRTGHLTYDGGYIIIYSTNASDGTYVAEAGTSQDSNGLKIHYYRITRKQ